MKWLANLCLCYSIAGLCLIVSGSIGAVLVGFQGRAGLLVLVGGVIAVANASVSIAASLRNQTLTIINNGEMRIVTNSLVVKKDGTAP